MVIHSYIKMLILVCLVMLGVMAPSSLGLDLFSSQYHMEGLAHRESQLFHFLQTHIAHRQAKLTMLMEKYEQLSRAVPADQTSEQYLGHPINAFSLIRRLVRVWPLILHLMVEQTEIPQGLLSLPNENDVQNAVKGLARLQDVYRLETDLIASGTVSRTSGEHRVNITAMDCYEIGKHWYQQMQFYYAASWFDQALLKISQGDLTVQRQLVMSHLYLARTFSGCLTSYQTAPTNDLMYHTVMDHPNLNLNGDLSFDFRQALARNCSWVLSNAREIAELGDELSHEQNKIYSDMCLGLHGTPAGLKCYYVHYNNPRLLIAPFKLEELFLEPPLLMFHDVISDQEAEDMKNSFYGVMGDCETARNQTARKSYFRTCHVGWVPDEQSKTSATITRRAGDMSTMAMDSSEYNQVASYGLGGEFKPHNDPISIETLSGEQTLNWNNRIATVMYYLNDVASGGRTIFPRIGVSVIPKKGAAILWYNLDKYGHQLNEMVHGGCPVLKGDKYVINKWIREAGQDPVKTCPKEGRFPEKYFYLNNNHK